MRRFVGLVAATAGCLPPPGDPSDPDLEQAVGGPWPELTLEPGVPTSFSIAVAGLPPDAAPLATLDVAAGQALTVAVDVQDAADDGYHPRHLDLDVPRSGEATFPLGSLGDALLTVTAASPTGSTTTWSLPLTGDGASDAIFGWFGPDAILTPPPVVTTGETAVPGPTLALQPCDPVAFRIFASGAPTSADGASLRLSASSEVTSTLLSSAWYDDADPWTGASLLTVGPGAAAVDDVPVPFDGVGLLHATFAATGATVLSWSLLVPGADGRADAYYDAGTSAPLPEGCGPPQ